MLDFCIFRKKARKKSGNFWEAGRVAVAPDCHPLGIYLQGSLIEYLMKKRLAAFSPQLS